MDKWITAQRELVLCQCRQSNETEGVEGEEERPSRARQSDGVYRVLGEGDWGEKFRRSLIVYGAEFREMRVPRSALAPCPHAELYSGTGEASTRCGLCSTGFKHLAALPDACGAKHTEIY